MKRRVIINIMSKNGGKMDLTKEKEKKKHGLGSKGYSLVELMVVIAIMAILAATGTGIYTGYIEKAKTATLLETARQIKEALMVCETEYLALHDVDAMTFWSEEFLAKPNDPDSVLYPYVGEVTEDCTGYTLKTGKSADGAPQIKGFTYDTTDYRVVWRRDGDLTVTKKEE